MVWVALPAAMSLVMKEVDSAMPTPVVLPEAKVELPTALPSERLEVNQLFQVALPEVRVFEGAKTSRMPAVWLLVSMLVMSNWADSMSSLVPSAPSRLSGNAKLIRVSAHRFPPPTVPTCI